MKKKSGRPAGQEMFSKLTENMYMFFRMSSMTTYTIAGGVTMSLAELSMLARIREVGSTQVTRLAQETEVTKGAVSLVASKLARKGLVKKTADPENRTRVGLSLTQEGKDVAERFLALHEDKNRELLGFLGSLDASQAETVDSFLDQMRAWLMNFRNAGSDYFLS